MFTTEQVLATHEAALNERNDVKVSTFCLRDAKAIVDGGTYWGQSDTTLIYANFINYIPNATWCTDMKVNSKRETLAMVQ
jgi:hypothetical protein